MEYFDCTAPSGNGRCSDNNCPCPDVVIPRGQGYLCITQDLVDFRSKYPGEQEADIGMRIKLAAKQVMTGMKGLNPTTFYSIGPILVCEQGARLRKLDLKVAGADAAHWWKTGKVPLRPTPTLESRRFTGRTVQEAKANAVRELTEDRIATIEVVHDVRSEHVTGEGSSQDEALQAAKKRVGTESIDVAEPRITRKGDTGVVTVEKQDEKEAGTALRGLVLEGARLGNVECVLQPKKGFLGLGKRMGQWKANWTLSFRAEVDFKKPAVVEAILKKTDPT